MYCNNCYTSSDYLLCDKCYLDSRYLNVDVLNDRCVVCNVKSSVNICRECSNHELTKCDCGYIITKNSVRCRICNIFSVKCANLKDDSDTYECIYNYHHDYLSNSAQLFEKIYSNLKDDKFILVDNCDILTKYLKKINLGVRTLTGKVIPLVLDNQASNIYLIKCMIREKDGIPCIQQRLISRGRQLEDNRSLKEYNDWYDGVIINLVLRMRGD